MIAVGIKGAKEARITPRWPIFFFFLSFDILFIMDFFALILIFKNEYCIKIFILITEWVGFL